MIKRQKIDSKRLPDSLDSIDLSNINMDRLDGFGGINIGFGSNDPIDIPDDFSEQIKFWQTRLSKNPTKYIRHKPKRSELSIPFRHEDPIWRLVDIADKDNPNDIDSTRYPYQITDQDKANIQSIIQSIVNKYALFIRQWAIFDGVRSFRVEIAFRDGYDITMIQDILNIIKQSLPVNFKLYPDGVILQPIKMIDKQGKITFEIIKLTD